MIPNAAHFKKEINNSFPRSKNFVDVIFQPYDDDEVDFEKYLKKQDWTHVECDFWRRHAENVTLLLPEAFVYFLPSLLCCAIDEIEHFPLSYTINEILFRSLVESSCSSSISNFVNDYKSLLNESNICIIIKYINLVRQNKFLQKWLDSEGFSRSIEYWMK